MEQVLLELGDLAGFSRYYLLLTALYSPICQQPGNIPTKAGPGLDSGTTCPEAEHLGVSRLGETSLTSQSSLLETFMNSQPKKRTIMKKSELGQSRSLLSEFMSPKQVADHKMSTRKSQQLILAKDDLREHKQLEVPLDTEPVKKFVDLNQFRKRKRKSQAVPAEEQKENIHSNLPVGNSSNNYKDSRSLFTKPLERPKYQIEDILKGGNLYQTSQHNNHTDYVDPQNLELFDDYVSTFYQKTQLSAVKEEDLEESVARGQIIGNTDFQVANISLILPKANASFDLELQLLDLQKFVVDDLRLDLESLCAKLNSSGVYHSVVPMDQQQMEEEAVLPDIRIRMERLRQKMLTECPFLEQ